MLRVPKKFAFYSKRMLLPNKRTSVKRETESELELLISIILNDNVLELGLDGLIHTSLMIYWNKDLSFFFPVGCSLFSALGRPLVVCEESHTHA